MARILDALALDAPIVGAGNDRALEPHRQRAVLAALALASAIVVWSSPSAAQSPSPSFAAGGMGDWGTSVSGSASKAAPVAKGSAAAPGGIGAPSKPQRPRAAKRKPASPDAEAQTPAPAQPPAASAHVFAPAGVLSPGLVNRGPIIVRPPAGRAATAPAGVLPVTAPVAPPSAAPRPADQTAGGECLAVHQIGPGTYQIENAGCRSSSVLATIEIRNGRGSRSITCYIARIRDAYAVTSPPGSPPRINHQCRDGTPGCAEAVLKGMFPECRGSV